MGIRVEYGPSAVAVGELAYRTGQNEYRKERRSQLEKLAMQQAEMRQRSQMQQIGIMADLQGQQMREQGAMQRLQMQHMMGQEDQQDQFAHQMKMAEDARQHALDIQDIYGQRAVDQAKLTHNLAGQRDIERIQLKEMVDMFDNQLNDAGKEHGMGILDQIKKLEGDTRIAPDERERLIAEKREELAGLKDDPMWAIGAKDAIGYEEPWGRSDDGINSSMIRKRIGPDQYVFKPSLTRKVKNEDGTWSEATISDAEWWEQDGFKVIEKNGMRVTLAANLETGTYDAVKYESIDPNTEAKNQLEIIKAYQGFIEKRAEDVDELGNPLPTPTFKEWQIEMGLMEPDPEPEPEPQPVQEKLTPEQRENLAIQEQAEAQRLDQMEQGLPPQAPAAPMGTREAPHQVTDTFQMGQAIKHGQAKPGDFFTLMVDTDGDGIPDKPITMQYGAAPQ